MKLYTYYRSTASYRVRIALNYKNIAHESATVNLITDEQLQTNYQQYNPQGRLPALQIDNFTVGQSMAILEYLEEAYPKPALLPTDLQQRAWIRYISQIIVSDIHPLNNSGVIKYLKETLHHSQEETLDWYHHWLRKGFNSLEEILAKNIWRGNCCVGDTVTFADICLIPQIYNAHRFNFSMDAYPTLSAINNYCLNLPYFEKAQPEKQSDYIDPRDSIVV